ncbi:hypothetical protein L6258_01455 [Candidatus Parcubacteria bacterium]|nr:hypothetical protein [Candidatus Parcubacteria bacterium]
MPIDNFLEELITSFGKWEFSAWPLFKLFLLLFLACYLVFAAVVVRQVQLLNRILGTRLSPFLKLFSSVLFLVVLFLFLAVLVG